MVNSNKYRNVSRTTGDIELGRELAYLRLSRGMTQAQLADALTTRTPTSWTQVRVTNFETGRTPLTLANFVQICQVLDVSPAYMLSRVLRGGWSVPAVDMPEVRPLPGVARLWDDITPWGGQRG